MNAHTFAAQFKSASTAAGARHAAGRMHPVLDKPRTAAGRHAAQGESAVGVLAERAMHVVERMPAGNALAYMAYLAERGEDTAGMVHGKAPKRDELTGGAMRAWLKAGHSRVVGRHSLTLA